MAENNGGLNIQEVFIGPAAEFRKTINDNFKTIKDNWSGIVRTDTQANANAALKEGGIWLQTDSSTNNDETSGVSENEFNSDYPFVTIRKEIIDVGAIAPSYHAELHFLPHQEGEILYFLNRIPNVIPPYEAQVPSDIYIGIWAPQTIGGIPVEMLCWYDLITGAITREIEIIINRTPITPGTGTRPQE